MHTQLVITPIKKGLKKGKAQLLVKKNFKKVRKDKKFKNL